MAQYNTLNENVSNSKLNKLKKSLSLMKNTIKINSISMQLFGRKCLAQV